VAPKRKAEGPPGQPIVARTRSKMNLDALDYIAPPLPPLRRTNKPKPPTMPVEGVDFFEIPVNPNPNPIPIPPPRDPFADIFYHDENWRDFGDLVDDFNRPHPHINPFIFQPAAPRPNPNKTMEDKCYEYQFMADWMNTVCKMERCDSSSSDDDCE